MAPSVSPGSAGHILLVEDDAEISRMLRQVLAENGFTACWATSAAEMEPVLERGNVDLVVLDVMLPGEDGFSICRRLRATSGIPIIMLTALGEHVNRIAGLEIGADDYVTKPFNSRELVARIRALLRRTYDTSLSRGRPRALRFAGWLIDPTSRQLRNPEDVLVAMTSAEFDLLLAFCRNPGQVLSREQLLDLTHGGSAGPIERSIDVHVSRVRQKIEPDPHDPSFIKTVRLAGYIFTPAVKEV
ncbi:MAG: DNA-binding response regulator [Betaproteobacteria bacterium RIFCSPLOWO2_02_FULL_65_24]|nr:MAG: DNA-binding response regulator [Betaproteobacteria bacterium RIFCSPLOWO2_02_FULL_65_24]